MYSYIVPTRILNVVSKHAHPAPSLLPSLLDFNRVPDDKFVYSNTEELQSDSSCDSRL